MLEYCPEKKSLKELQQISIKYGNIQQKNDDDVLLVPDAIIARVVSIPDSIVLKLFDDLATGVKEYVENFSVCFINTLLNKTTKNQSASN